MLKKKTINPINLHIISKKVSKGGGIYTLPKKSANYKRGWGNVHLYCNTQGLRICLKRK